MKRLQVYVFVLAAALLLMNCAGGKTPKVTSGLEKFRKGYKTKDLGLMQVYMNQAGLDTQDGDYILVITNTMFREGLFWDKSYPVREDNNKYLMAIPWKKGGRKGACFSGKNTMMTSTFLTTVRSAPGGCFQVRIYRKTNRRKH